MLQFGGLIVDTPAAGLRLLPDHWDRLESAATWAAQGFAAGARRIIAGLEADLAREASLRASAVAARAARAAHMAVRKGRTTLPAHERGMAEVHIKQFSKARRKLELGVATVRGVTRPLTDVERALLAAEMGAIEQAPRKTADEASLKARLAEMETLERMRDPGVTVTQASTGLLRIHRETSLDSLVASGAITMIERAAGEKYREIFEAAALIPSLKVADWSATGGGEVDHVGIGLKAILEAQKAAETLNGKDGEGGLHAYIASSVPGSRAVWILKLVAGEGRRISHIPMGGAGRARSTKALQLALSALAHKWGLR